MNNQNHEQMLATMSNDESPASFHKVLLKVADIYDVKELALRLNDATGSHWTRESLNRQIKGAEDACCLTLNESRYLRTLVPSRPANYDQKFFRFINLFAGIGGLRSGFDAIGGKCVFTSEWNRYSSRTYRANWYCDESEHVFNFL
ncbi:DNA cytosine methyltransferase [Photorhabdus tasmaniensis]